MSSINMVVILAAVFVAVGLMTGLTISWAFSSTSVERRRLRSALQSPQAAPLPEMLTLSTEQKADGWQDLTRLLGRSSKDISRLRTRLSRAGFDYPSAPAIYTLIEFGGPFVLGVIPLLVLTGQTAWFAAAAVAGLTFFAPGLLIEQRLSRLRREIENGLPDALDLLVVCIEAGSGLDQAILKTADELAIAYPALANELRILTAEIRAGKPRLEAFKNLAQRTKVDDVRSLVAMLVQTDRFGTSIGQALRTHADVSRTKRRQRAEERAQKIGVKLVFPLVLCFFPAFYVVVMGPAVIQFIRVFMRK